MIEPKIINQLYKIGQRENKINKIVLFGSRAAGDHSEKSDIDLAFVAPNMTNKDWTEFTFNLEEELDTLLLLDLIRYEDAPIELKDEILQNGKVLYSAKSERKTS